MNDFRDRLRRQEIDIRHETVSNAIRFLLTVAAVRSNIIYKITQSYKIHAGCW